MYMKKNQIIVAMILTLLIVVATAIYTQPIEEEEEDEEQEEPEVPEPIVNETGIIDVQFTVNKNDTEGFEVLLNDEVVYSEDNVTMNQTYSWSDTYDIGSYNIECFHWNGTMVWYQASDFELTNNQTKTFEWNDGGGVEFIE